ncbi:MAG: dehydrogenase [Dehalococcoidia bacterium]|jgi:nitrate reductase beta subunit|nr:dehydrogenase [Dehalococcoidia bacterium]MDW8009717.1 4Fe-4S dicluster domain-containing protein [Chloroflexota bacterium]
MPRVYNWQIGREMEYPFEAARPKRQAAAVFDINKCIACQTCTMACKTTWTSGRGQEYMFWNNVETKPWGSYPLAWDVRILEMLGPQTWQGGRYTGKTIFEAAPLGEKAIGYLPEDLDYAYPNRGEDEISDASIGQRFYLRLPHDAWFFYLPRICNHCTYPACLGSCPRTAIYKRPEDGIVLVDQERCRGYRECVKNCPYKKVFYNHVTRVAEKCVLCYPAVERGIQPRCMRNCIGKIRTFGFVNTPDKADPENPVDFLVHVRKVALPLLPQLGLEPNVYYIPPVHVGNLDFLRMLFGPGVDNAIAAYRRAMAGEDPELVGVLMLAVSTDRIVHRFRVRDGYAYGYGEDGSELVRVPLKEPVTVRQFYDSLVGAYRYNVT